MLNFTVSRIHRFNGQGPTKAMCDVAICDELLVKGFRVVEGKNGLFVGVPREQGKDGKWYNSVSPLTPETRQVLEEAVLSAYNTEKGS